MNTKQPNPASYIPNPNYYETTKDRLPEALLVEAVDLLDTDRNIALDLGCGAGRDTQYLLDHSFTVTAVDNNQDAEEYIMRLNHSNRAQFIHSDFESFTFDSYDLVTASFSLPFLHRNVFDNVLQRLLTSIRPGGIFTGQFFGIHDEWNKPTATMTFTDRQGVEALFANIDILTLKEKEVAGTIADGNPKYWHLLSFLVKKPEI